MQGLAWDAWGQLYACEFGDRGYGELNRIFPGRTCGRPDADGIGAEPNLTNPVARWSPGNAAVRRIAILGDKVYGAGPDPPRDKRHGGHLPASTPRTS